MEPEKSKEKGEVKATERVFGTIEFQGPTSKPDAEMYSTARGVNFLNGEVQSKNTFVPIQLLQYKAPESAKQFAKAGERFAIWIKLEDATYHEIVKQLNPNLKELTIWMDDEQKARLLAFLQSQS